MRVIARVTPPSEFQARVKNVHGSCREKAPPGEDRFLVVTHPVIVTTLEAACIYICHEVKCCSPTESLSCLIIPPSQILASDWLILTKISPSLLVQSGIKCISHRYLKSSVRVNIQKNIRRENSKKILGLQNTKADHNFNLTFHVT